MLTSEEFHSLQIRGITYTVYTYIATVLHVSPFIMYVATLVYRLKALADYSARPKFAILCYAGISWSSLTMLWKQTLYKQIHEVVLCSSYANLYGYANLDPQHQFLSNQYFCCVETAFVLVHTDIYVLLYIVSCLLKALCYTGMCSYVVYTALCPKFCWHNLPRSNGCYHEVLPPSQPNLLFQ